MEVLKYTDILPKIAGEDIYEGRMVLLSPVKDVMRLPSTAAEAALSRYVIAWPVENRQLPIYEPYPTYTRALRLGFDNWTGNTPFTAVAYTTYMNLQEEPLELPSGNAALVFDEGEFIVTSGNWVYDAAMKIGDELEVNYTGANAGKLQLKDQGTAVAIVTDFPATRSLQFRSYGD